MQFNILDVVFGKDSTGDTPEERAATSKRVWVRSQDGLAIFSEGATGRVLTSSEALERFGMATLHEALDYGSAILIKEHGEPMKTIKNRREELGWILEEVALRTGLTVEEVADAENPRTASSIRKIERVCEALGLDERLISFESGALSITPGVCGGVARIRNTRIPVWTLAAYRRLGTSDAEILGMFPGLSEIDLRAAWKFEAENPDEINFLIQDNENDKDQEV